MGHSLGAYAAGMAIARGVQTRAFVGLAGLAPRARVIYTQGLGHYRILRSATVLDAIVRHLATREAGKAVA